MLTKEEKQFLDYWEQHRNQKLKYRNYWKAGLPLGLMIAVGIILNLITGWYRRATMVLNTHPSVIIILLIAIICIVLFISFFTARHRWEMNELRYHELKYREQSDSKTEN